MFRVVLLAVVSFSISTTTDGFVSPSFRRCETSSRMVALRMSDIAEASKTANGSSAVERTGQAIHGMNGEPYPETYVKCGRCKSVYALLPEDLGPTNGCRIECTVCGNNWFQTKDRINRLGRGFEMLELPQFDKDRIKLNIAEGKDPSFIGDGKLYVGNLPFECDEEALYDLFSECGNVGEAFVVRGEDGRGRGFAFVTMRTVEEFEKALEQLDGVEFMGRAITVNESTKNKR